MYLFNPHAGRTHTYSPGFFPPLVSERRKKKRKGGNGKKDLGLIYVYTTSTYNAQRRNGMTCRSLKNNTRAFLLEYSWCVCTMLLFFY